MEDSMDSTSPQIPSPPDSPDSMQPPMGQMGVETGMANAPVPPQQEDSPDMVTGADPAMDPGVMPSPEQEGPAVAEESPAQLLARAVGELTRAANAKSAAMDADANAMDGIGDAEAQLAVAEQHRRMAIDHKVETAAGIEQANARGMMAGEQVNAAVSTFVNANFG